MAAEAEPGGGAVAQGLRVRDWSRNARGHLRTLSIFKQRAQLLKATITAPKLTISHTKVKQFQKLQKQYEFGKLFKTTLKYYD